MMYKCAYFLSVHLLPDTQPNIMMPTTEIFMPSSAPMHKRHPHQPSGMKTRHFLMHAVDTTSLLARCIWAGSSSKHSSSSSNNSNPIHFHYCPSDSHLMFEGTWWEGRGTVLLNLSLQE